MVPAKRRAPLTESLPRTSAVALVLGVLLHATAGAGCRRREVAELPRAPSLSSVAARPHSCRSTADCAPYELCVFDPGRCGRGPNPGTCQPRPKNCTGGYAPVCGCDGKIYEDECRAHNAGVDLAVEGGCRTQIPDWIACGPRFCDARTSYCEIYLSDVPELPTDHACRPLPPACVAHAGVAVNVSCDCFPKETPCLSFCGPMPTGGRQGFHLTCQGKKPPVGK